MELGNDFIFRDDLFDANGDKTTVPIELKVDPFQNIVYRYTQVAFKMGEDNVPRMQFDYDILKTNDLSMVTLRKNQKFNTVLGLVLNTLLLDASEQQNGMDVETRTDNHKEPDQE